MTHEGGQLMRKGAGRILFLLFLIHIVPVAFAQAGETSKRGSSRLKGCLECFAAQKMAQAVSQSGFRVKAVRDLSEVEKGH
jgi:hypothetical protein